MSVLTAEFAARFERPRTGVRARIQPPEHAQPFTLIAVATAFALLFLPTGELDYREASAAAVLSAALIGLALCWPMVPRVATTGYLSATSRSSRCSAMPRAGGHRASVASSCFPSSG